MTISEIKAQIALQHLNLAIRQHLAGKDCYSVIHLAGAAEEILGELVRKSGDVSSFQRVKNQLNSWLKITQSKTSISSLIKQCTLVRNEMKHFNSDDMIWVEKDMREEAERIIDRAIGNINLLRIPCSHETLEYLKR
jgi:hypothetical protein